MKRIRSKIFLISLLLFAKMPNQIQAGIPSIKELYEVFTYNDIGFGQALLYSKWVKYFYIYGPDDSVRKLVRTLWTVLEDRAGKPVESEKLKYTVRVVPIKELTPEVFGEIMAAMYKNGFTKEGKKRLVNVWIESQLDEIEKMGRRITNLNIQKIIRDLDDYTGHIAAKKKEESGETLTNEEKKLLSKKKTKWAKKFKPEIEAKKLKKIEEENSDLLRWLGIEADLDIRKKRETLQAKVKEISKHKRLKKERGEIKESIKKKDVLRIIQTLGAALKKSDKYMPRTVEAILWAFFEARFEGKEDIKKCLQAIADNVGKDVIFADDYKEKVKSDEFYKKYTKKELRDFELDFADETTDKIEYVLDDYDLAMSSLVYSVKMGKFPPKVPTERRPYVYAKGKETEPFGICFEAAFLDMVSMLWFRPYSTSKEIDNSGYDDSFFPAKGDFFKQLKKILQKYSDDGKPDPANIKDIDVVKAWISAISNQEDIYYVKKVGAKKYEVEACEENFIIFLNKFFGLQEKKIENFGSKLSVSGIRDVIFEIKKTSWLPESFENIEMVGKKRSVKKTIHYKNIKIRVAYKDEDKKVYNFEMFFEAMKDHANLRCEKRDRARPDVYTDKFVKSLRDEIVEENGTEVFNKLTPFLTLLTDPDLLYKEKNIKLLRLIYYSLYLENIKVKSEVLNHVFKSQAYKKKDIRVLTDELIEKINKDEDPYIYQMYASIMNAKAYKEFSGLFFDHPTEALIAICRLKKEIYGQDKDFLLPLAKQLIKTIDGDDINKKIDVNTPLLWAVLNQKADLVKAIVEHDAVDFDVENPLNNLDALGIAARRKYGDIRDVLEEAMAKDIR
ncbi:hypothetical protein ACFLYA_00145 [Candidatus Dependentiae bacterium]